MNIEQKTLVCLRCLEQNFIRHSKKDTTDFSKKLLKRTRDKIKETEDILEVKKLEEVLNGEYRRERFFNWFISSFRI